MRRHILFDLDGTLTDPMVGITSSVQYALRRFGIEVRYLKELVPFIGPPLKESFQKFYGFDSAQADLAVEYYREYFSPVGIFENEIYPDTEKMLSCLKNAGFELYVASSKPTVYVERILEHFGIRDYFSYVCGSELDGRRVLKKDVVSRVLWKCGIPASDAVMVGDRRHDIEGARYCGVFSVGVLYGYGSEDELKKAGACHLVESVEKLADFLLHQEEEKEDHSLIRFGIVGTGDLAEKFYQANRFSQGFELAAVYDEDPERADAFCARKGRISSYKDLSDLAGAEDIDAVYIAGPVRLHYDQARTLMKAGKHVLCRAPLWTDLSGTGELFRIAEEENVILMEAVPAIYTPGFKKMSAYIRSLGPVRRATFSHCLISPDYDSYKRGDVKGFFDPEISQGSLMEMGICPAACMAYLFGEPEQVMAAGVFLDDGPDVTGTVLLSYKDMTGELLCSAVTKGAVSSQIQGEEGAMMIREIENVKDLLIYRNGVKQTIHFEQSDNIQKYVTEAFMKAVRTGTGWEKARDNTFITVGILEQAAGQIRRKKE